jgi:pimeloyl-ACP methyl ester carboxylesterase
MQTLIDHRRIADVPVLEFYNPQATGRLPLIIVMHGFTGRKEDSFPVCLSLARTGYYVTSIDLYLHGEAGQIPFDPSSVAWRMNEVVERSCDFLDSLLKAYGENNASLADPCRAGLLGISLGGAVIYRFLMRHVRTGSRASGVRAAVALIAGLMHVWPETLRRALPLYPAFGVNQEMIQAAQEFLRTSPPPPFLDGIRDFPLLMQYGQSDPLIPIDAVREVFSLASQGYQQKDLLQLVEYEACGHETPPAMYTRAVEWFARYL